MLISLHIQHTYPHFTGETDPGWISPRILALAQSQVQVDLLTWTPIINQCAGWDCRAPVSQVVGSESAGVLKGKAYGIIKTDLQNIDVLYMISCICHYIIMMKRKVANKKQNDDL